MSLKTTVTVDTRGLNKAIRELAAVTDKTLDEVLHQQAKLAVKDAIALTPPFQKFGSATSRKHLKAGENAITRDLNNVFTPSNESFIDAAITANNGSRRFITRKHRKKDGTVFLTDWAIASTSMSEMEPFHKARLRSGNAMGRGRGRIKGGGKGSKDTGRWKEEHRMVVPYGNLHKYAKQIKARVGFAKDGWSTAAYKLGLKVQRWIARHDAPGGYQAKLGKGVREKFIQFSNAVSYIKHTGLEARILKQVYKNRQSRMTSQVKRIFRASAAGKLSSSAAKFVAF
ncbi:MAG: hypothetical protein GY904_15310 [Planctomycetaceae bacterium]|nr:hypothetical protein [Planctomycetaceae bacterium]